MNAITTGEVDYIGRADLKTLGMLKRNPKLAIKIMEDVPCDKLPGVLEGLIPYHTREKMHRVRGGEARKRGAAVSGMTHVPKELERVSGSE